MASNRVKITLACMECGDRNYTTTQKQKASSGAYGSQKVLPQAEAPHDTQGDKVGDAGEKKENSGRVDHRLSRLRQNHVVTGIALCEEPEEEIISL